MINKLFNKIKYTFILSTFQKDLQHAFQMDKKDSENIVLVQCVEDPLYFPLFGTIVKEIQNKTDIRVEQYVARNLTLGSSSNLNSFFKSIFLNNRVRDNKWIKLYAAYCSEVAYRHEGSTSFIVDIKLWKQAYKIYKSLNSKEKLLDLKVDDILIGDLVYDSYLRFKPAPTVSLNDFYLCIVIWQALRNLYLAKRYFDKKKAQSFIDIL